jgi:predicted CDP-diglyceride synthetase/phosphatidate cytidylyltransferase
MLITIRNSNSLSIQQIQQVLNLIWTNVHDVRRRMMGWWWSVVVVGTSVLAAKNVLLQFLLLLVVHPQGLQQRGGRERGRILLRLGLL